MNQALHALRLFMDQYDRPGDARRAQRPEIIAGRAALAAADLSCPQIDRLDQISHLEAARPYGKAAVERAEMEISHLALP